MSTMIESPDLEARTHAVRALEGEVTELINQYRQVLVANAERLSRGLLPGAYKVFTTIVRMETTTTSALADALMMDKGQLSRTVRELEHLGLVHRTPDPADGRSSLLSPTAEGLDRLAAARRPYENSLVTTLDDWPVEEINHLARLLRALSSGTTP
jgi:DNA-binding MarR family transcriptional regulator